LKANEEKLVEEAKLRNVKKIWLGASYLGRPVYEDLDLKIPENGWIWPSFRLPPSNMPLRICQILYRAIMKNWMPPPSNESYL